MDRSRTIRPLAASPKQTAVLLDVDGTLAPIVDLAADASVPIEVRRTLIEMARRFGLIGCVSGRTADDAKRVVGVAAITYIGGHGSELLLPGMAHAQIDAELEPWSDPVNELAIEAMRELSPIGVRREEKGAVVALHWRGVADEGAARHRLEKVAVVANERGLTTHWGRMVLEIRPPVAFDKGRAIERLISAHSEISTVVYAGDDTTDIDAFQAIDRMLKNGTISQGLRIAVESTESPQELLRAADASVEGPQGVANLLSSMLEGTAQ